MGRVMADNDNPSDQEIADALRGLDPQPNTLTRTFEVEFERIRCISCDISFYASKYWCKQRRITHNSFYCPNGHGMSFGKTEEYP